MKEKAIAAALATGVLLAAGCAESKPDSTPVRPAPTTVDAQPRPKPKTGAAKFTGMVRETYRNAKTTCAVFPRRQLAHQYGAASMNPVDIAEAMAKHRWGEHRQATFDGCLAALLKNQR